MLVLVQLEEILVKGSYYESTNYSVLTDFLMETGKSRVGGDGVLIATSVEICQCPAPYTGDSCQVSSFVSSLYIWMSLLHSVE